MIDDFGNDILTDYTPRVGNWNPPAFNWTAYVYYLRLDLVKIEWH
jgi:hypothetical protein